MKNQKFNFTEKEIINIYQVVLTAEDHFSDFIQESEDTKNYYFWCGSYYKGHEEEHCLKFEGTTYQIRQLKTCTKISSFTYFLKQDFSASNANVYRSQTIKVNKKSTNLTRVRSLAKYTKEALLFLETLPAIQKYNKKKEALKKQKEIEKKNRKVKMNQILKRYSLQRPGDDSYQVIQRKKELVQLLKKELIQKAKKLGIFNSIVYKSYTKPKMALKIALYEAKKEYERVRATLFVKNGISIRQIPVNQDYSIEI